MRDAETSRDDETALAAARRARDLGAATGPLIARLEASLERARKIQARDALAAELLAALEEAGSKHGDPEFSAEQVDAACQTALRSRA